jgi:four helix bundle protein
MKNGAAIQDLRTRTKSFALRIIRLFSALPKSAEAQTLGRQLLRSGTSVGAQYREACRARSTAEFISKVEGGLQELEETAYWLELLEEGGIVPSKRLSELKAETNELTAVLVACVRNAKRKRQAEGLK